MSTTNATLKPEMPSRLAGRGDTLTADLCRGSEASSAARQFGRHRVLSELYGCTGWDFTFEGMKWVGDWQ